MTTTPTDRRSKPQAMHNDGFTILEVLAAILIVGIIMGALVFTSPLFLGLKNNSSTYAYNAARQGLEAYRSSWSIPANFLAGTTPPGIPLSLNSGCSMSTPTVENYELVQSGTTYTLTASTASTGTPDIRKVEITVICPKLKDVVLSTEIADPTVEVQ